MVEIWDEELDKRLDKKICDVCGEKLEVGEDFILKDKKFFHERCYRKQKAEQIKEGDIEIDESVEKSEKDFDKNISNSSFGEESD
ncbi:MAG: hypothetical protein V5A66_02145 [Candidatus Thermoplasmatota archaeon]